jgi:hypothetical protein
MARRRRVSAGVALIHSANLHELSPAPFRLGMLGTTSTGRCWCAVRCVAVAPLSNWETCAPNVGSLVPTMIIEAWVSDARRANARQDAQGPGGRSSSHLGLDAGKDFQGIRCHALIEVAWMQRLVPDIFLEIPLRQVAAGIHVGEDDATIKLLGKHHSLFDDLGVLLGNDPHDQGTPSCPAIR